MLDGRCTTTSGARRADHAEPRRPFWMQYYDVLSIVCVLPCEPSGILSWSTSAEPVNAILSTPS
jgi:hypothetical protein